MSRATTPQTATANAADLSEPVAARRDRDASRIRRRPRARGCAVAWRSEASIAFSASPPGGVRWKMSVNCEAPSIAAAAGRRREQRLGVAGGRLKRRSPSRPGADRRRPRRRRGRAGAGPPRRPPAPIAAGLAGPAGVRGRQQHARRRPAPRRPRAAPRSPRSAGLGAAVGEPGAARVEALGQVDDRAARRSRSGRRAPPAARTATAPRRRQRDQDQGAATATGSST